MLHIYIIALVFSLSSCKLRQSSTNLSSRPAGDPQAPIMAGLKKLADGLGVTDTTTDRREFEVCYQVDADGSNDPWKLLELQTAGHHSNKSPHSSMMLTDRESGILPKGVYSVTSTDYRKEYIYSRKTEAKSSDAKVKLRSRVRNYANAVVFDGAVNLDDRVVRDLFRSDQFRCFRK